MDWQNVTNSNEPQVILHASQTNLLERGIVLNTKHCSSKLARVVCNVSN